MREKLLDLMKNEGLKPSQLAEMLEINPAGISHILAGRNKPGFDLLQKILRRFPQINPDWLMLDSPKMYRTTEEILGGSAGKPVAPNSAATVGGLFDNTATIHPSSGAIPSTVENRPIPNLSAIVGNVSDTRTGDLTAGTTAVVRVVVFYDDKTFESFSPKQK